MSRSYKKPYVSNTCIGSDPGMQKDWKRERNKVLRSKVDLPDGMGYRKLGEKWATSPNDGRSYRDDDKARRK